MPFEMKNLRLAMIRIEDIMVRTLETCNQDEGHDPCEFWRAACQQIAELPIPANRKFPQICAGFRSVYALHAEMEQNWVKEGASENDKRYLLDFFVRAYEISLTRRMLAEVADMTEFELERVISMARFLDDSVTQRMSLRACTKEDASYCEMRKKFRDLLLDCYRFYYLSQDHNSKIAQWFGVREACQGMKETHKADFLPNNDLLYDDTASSSRFTAPSLTSRARSSALNMWSSIKEMSIGSNSASGASKNTIEPGSTNTAS